MNRKRRTHILIEGNSELAERLADEIRGAYGYRELVAPRQGLTMIKMRESAKNTLFYIGEVLVTDAKVEVEGKIGHGIVAGMKEELAGHLAVIDAAYRAELPETKVWTAVLEAEEVLLRQEQLRRQAELRGTKVQFETMDN